VTFVSQVPPAPRRAGDGRRLIGGLLAVGVVYGPLVLSPYNSLTWGILNYGPLLSLLPGMVLVAVLAPRVSYRRRDLFLVPLGWWGAAAVWRMGARLASLPDRWWPPRPGEAPPPAEASFPAPCA
jgi:hypothetical protein